MRFRFLAIILAALLSISSTAFAAELVDADWLKKNLGNKNLKVLDVADKASSFAKEHIPGAIQVRRYLDLSDTHSYPPTSYPTATQFAKFLSEAGVENNSTIVAYDDKSSLFAARLLFLLELYGHDTNKLKLLNGGIVNWKKQGNRVTEEATPVKKSAYKIARAKDKTIGWSQIYTDVVLGAKPEVLLLDSRPENEFMAQNIRAIRGGYIPKAVLVTGTDANDKDTQLFKPADEIRAMYAAKGVTGEQPIYTYCHSGDRAAHSYFILKHILGYKNVKVYDGGWVEWGNLVALPAGGQVWQWDAAKPAKN